MGNFDDLQVLIKPEDLSRFTAMLESTMQDLAHYAYNRGYADCKEGKQRRSPWKPNG